MKVPLRLLQRSIRPLAHGLAQGLILLLALLAALAWLIATEPGLRFVVAQAQGFLPGLSVEQVEGRLMDELRLRGLRWRDARIDAQAALLHLRWDPQALRNRQLHIRALRVEGIRLIKREPPDQAPPQWPEWKLPLALAVDELQIKDASWQGAPKAEPIRVDRLDAAWDIDREKLHLSRLVLAMPSLAAELSGSVGLQGRRPLELATAWQAKWPGKPEIKSAGTVSGYPERLVLRQRLSLPLPAELTVTVANPLGKPTWAAEGRVPAFLLNRLDARLKPWPAALDLKADGGLEAGQAHVSYTVAVPDLGEARGRLQARYQPPGLVSVDGLTLSLPRIGAEFALDGKASNLGANPDFQVNARWKNLAWPPGPKAEWRSPEGRIKVAGDFGDIRFDLTGKLRDRPVEAGGNLSLTAGQTRFRGVRVRGAGTELAVDGTLGEVLDFTWNLRATDLGLWLPGARGGIDSHGTLQGPKSAPAAEAHLAAAGLSIGEYAADRMKLDLEAGLQADSPFRFRLLADKVRTYGRRLAADLTGEGTRGRHRLEGTVEGWRLPTPRSDKEWTADLTVAGDVHDDMATAPDASDNAAAMNPDRGPLRLEFRAEGGFQSNLWTGKLSHLDLITPPLGRFDLRQPVALKLGPEGGELAWACWDHQGAGLCLQAGIEAGGAWHGVAELSGLDLARFRDRVPEALALNGTINGRARFAGRGGSVAEGRLDLTMPGALAEFHSRAGQTLAFRPDPLSLRLEVNGAGAELDVEARQPGILEFDGHMRLAGSLEPERLRETPLRGRLRLALPALALLEPWTGQVQGLKGSFGADLEIEGTAAQPTLRLAASLPDGRFEVPPLGIAVRAFSLEARTGEDRTLRFSGRAVSGPGELRLDGTATLDGALGWPVTATLRGSRFLLADTPEARVFVSPDLGIEQAGGLLKLTGRVTVPEANFKAREQPGAIKPSPDVVMVGAEPPEAGSGLRMQTRVEVALGDKVRVEGYGFQGRLDGGVTVEQKPRGAVYGTGEITVREGRYAYYGVELAIHDGRLLFARSPIDNPHLAIDVNRRTDQGQTVGLKVLGTLKKPQASLYADRAMAQGDILAYLLTGRSLGMASSQEGGVLRDAASALGGPAGTFLAKEIGDRLGLGSFVDISVRGSLADSSFSQGFRSPTASGSGAQTTALFLGKYLTPKLYVQYGMGLFQNLYVLRLRYSLSENWKIQTETGQFSGGDILYQWER